MPVPGERHERCRFLPSAAQGFAPRANCRHASHPRLAGPAPGRDGPAGAGRTFLRPRRHAPRSVHQQPVAHPRLGHDVPGLCRIVLELLAQVVHVDTQVVRALRAGRHRSPRSTAARRRRRRRTARVERDRGVCSGRRRCNERCGGCQRRRWVDRVRKRPRHHTPSAATGCTFRPRGGRQSGRGPWPLQTRPERAARSGCGLVSPLPSLHRRKQAMRRGRRNLRHVVAWPWHPPDARMCVAT